ncbi:hypothetical protein Ciccas_000416 [Cichlidogyrus casuarinus]|uniref:Kalirin n=1 Tax=Cichlidogyrus casuarinus TaxID=1844966 RepID=A0ABD2QMY6_9PLAT
MKNDHYASKATDTYTKCIGFIDLVQASDKDNERWRKADASCRNCPQVRSGHHIVIQQSCQHARGQVLHVHSPGQPSQVHRQAHASDLANRSNINGGQNQKVALKASDLAPLLREKIALLPGGRTQRGGPILCFPSNSKADEHPFEELFMLVRYLTYLPDESIKKNGFAVVIDMRSGTTWHSVKPILKVLEECIGDNVTMTFIIKPDKFLEKQKASMNVAKFSFQIQVVSVENLFKEIDPSQLTVELEGSLPYNHEEWIRIRISLEDFFMFTHDMSDKFGYLFLLLDRKFNPENVSEAKRILEEHRNIKAKITQAPIDVLEAEADRLTTWLRYGITASDSGIHNQSFASSNSNLSCAASSSLMSKAGASFIATSWVSMNPDFQLLAPQVRTTITQLYDFRAHLQQKWDYVRARLEQIFQLRMFEDDAGRMAHWLDHQRNLFLNHNVDIGGSASKASELHAEHRQFLNSCTGVREQVTRLTGVAGMLSDHGHFASQRILKQASKLDHDWKSFMAALEDRSRMLQLSASFHSRAEAFFANCPRWEAAMRRLNGKGVKELNESLSMLHQYWQQVQSAHSEVCNEGRLLANHLSTPVPTGSHTCLAASVDYSQGRKHCTELVHELWTWYKQLERLYTDSRRRITARLALLMFKEDVGQVLAWLSDHGEPFLQRQTAIGKSSQRAEQLYNAHMQFEQVAANTLTNAEKLITAADELATQAEDPEEILQEASELQRRIGSFTRSVDSRRNTLELACGFYGHTKELFNWLHSLRESYNPMELLPSTIEGMEEELKTFHRSRQAMESKANQVANEGEALFKRPIDAEETEHLKSILVQVSKDKCNVSNLLSERQNRLELCLQLRLFEADTQKAPKHYPWLADPKQAPDIPSLEEVSHLCLEALPLVDDVINKGKELTLSFESLGINFPAGGPYSSGGADSGLGSDDETAVERVTRLLQELADSVQQVDDLNERIAGELDWRRLQIQSKNVLKWIMRCEEILHESTTIPTSLKQSDQLLEDHMRFQPVLSEAHPNAVQCASRASFLLQQANNSTGEHPRKADFKSVVDTVASQWQKLVYAAEERNKLLTAASNWYKTSEQVLMVLQQLDNEYRKPEDPCQTKMVSAAAEGSVISLEALQSYLSSRIDKMAEQKEAFMKACTLARRTAEHFLKYLLRQPASVQGRGEVEASIKQTHHELTSNEEAVLQVWTARKRSLDECAQFIKFSLSGHPSPRKASSNVAALPPLSPQNPIFPTVHKMITACDQASRANSLHSGQFKELVVKLGNLMPRTEFASRKSTEQQQPIKTQIQLEMGAKAQMPDLKTKLDETLGSSTSLGSTESATSATSSGIGSSISGLSVDQMKLQRKRENLIKELIHTEKLYVNWLKECLDNYLTGMRTTPPGCTLRVPAGIQGKEGIVFGNLAQIYKFHQSTFEPELSRYGPDGKFLPEDVGHCFVAHADQLADLYVGYCVNNPESTDLLISEAGSFFQQLQAFLGLTESLQSYLIKPVQRITKYQLILKELRECSDNKSVGELNEGLEVMLNVPKKANDAVHTSMLQGLPDELPLANLGDVILQEQFTILEPKQLIKKAKERRLFLFDYCLIVAKELPSLPGEHRGKYLYKSHHLLAECNITEHVEGDQCKFALWTGRVPQTNDFRIVIKANSLETKQNWVRAMREVMRDRMFSLQSLLDKQNEGGAPAPSKQASLDDSLVDNNGIETFYILENYQSTSHDELSVSAHQIVQVLHRCDNKPQLPKLDSQSLQHAPLPSLVDPADYNPQAAGDWALVRAVLNNNSTNSFTTSEG